MLGIFICFVLPGIVIGLLLGQGSKVVSRQAAKKQQYMQKEASLPVRKAASAIKKNLYVYDMRANGTAKRIDCAVETKKFRGAA